MNIKPDIEVSIEASTVRAVARAVGDIRHYETLAAQARLQRNDLMRALAVLGWTEQELADLGQLTQSGVNTILRAIEAAEVTQERESG